MYTLRQLEEMPIDKLDQMAFNLQDGQVLFIPIDQITIIYKDDLEGAKWSSGHNPQEWARGIDLSEPCDVYYQNDRFELADGHHRYLAATILGKPLKSIITIKDNPIKAILAKQDASHKDNR